jgi:excisionase family DNA binding protein
MVSEPILLKPEQAAELLGISRSQAYLLIRRGDLPHKRVRARLRVPLTALKAWAQHDKSEKHETAGRERSSS